MTFTVRHGKESGAARREPHEGGKNAPRRQTAAVGCGCLPAARAKAQTNRKKAPKSTESGVKGAERVPEQARKPPRGERSGARLRANIYLISFVSTLFCQRAKRETHLFPASKRWEIPL